MSNKKELARLKQAFFSSKNIEERARLYKLIRLLEKSAS